MGYGERGPMGDGGQKAGGKRQDKQLSELDSLPVPRMTTYPELKLYDFSIGKALKNNSALLVVTHYKLIGYILIP